MNSLVEELGRCGSTVGHQSWQLGLSGTKVPCAHPPQGGFHFPLFQITAFMAHDWFFSFVLVLADVAAYLRLFNSPRSDMAEEEEAAGRGGSWERADHRKVELSVAPIVGASNSTCNLDCWIGLGIALVLLVFANHKDRHLKLRRYDVKSRRDHNDFCPFQKKIIPVALTVESRMVCTIWAHSLISMKRVMVLVFILNSKLCHGCKNGKVDSSWSMPSA